MRPASAEPGWLGLGSLALVCSLTVAAYLDPRRQLAMDFGYEYGNIAQALAEGRGFSDPHQLGSGASAWMPPLLCWLMALVFRLLGSKTFEAAVVLSLVKLLALSLTLLLLWWAAGQRLPQLSRWALVALFGLGLAAHSSWLVSDLSDPWLVMLMVGLLLAGCSAGPVAARIDLLAAASAAFVSPALALAQAVLLAVRRQPARLTLLLGVGFLWCLRTYLALGLWAPIKSNGGFEFYQSHALSASGVLSSETLLRHHPIQARSALRNEFRLLGEAEFCQKYLGWSWHYLGQQPLEWLAKAGRRAFNALVYLQDPNDVRLGRGLTEEDRWQLEQVGLLLSTSRGCYWLCLSWPEEKLLQAMAEKPLVEPEGVLLSWREARRRLQRERSGWSHRLWGFCFAALPMLALLVGGARGLWRESAFREPALLYVLALLPYICVSHYARYQLGLLPLQCWLVWCAFSPRKERP